MTKKEISKKFKFSGNDGECNGCEYNDHCDKILPGFNKPGKCGGPFHKDSKQDMKKISLTESDLKIMVNETVKRVIKEYYGQHWKGCNPEEEYPCEGIDTISGEDLLEILEDEADYEELNLLDKEIDDLRSVLKPKYEMKYYTEDGYHMELTDDDGFIDDVEKIGNSKLNNIAKITIKGIEENTSLSDIEWESVDDGRDDGWTPYGGGAFPTLGSSYFE